MKLEKQDWQRLQVTISLLVVVVITVVALFVLAQKFTSEQEKAMRQQQSLLNSARQRYQSSGIEKQIMTEYLPQYQALINKGLVGEERRLEWVDELRKQHQLNKLFSIKYSIGLQEPYKPSFASNLGGFVLNRSVMTLDLDMLHEEDILELTEALSKKNEEVFMLRDCEITRLNAGGALSNQLIANLHAKCELDWLTLREPTPIQTTTPSTTP
jgi:type II secretory pathway pseudopilin PulG